MATDWSYGFTLVGPDAESAGSLGYLFCPFCNQDGPRVDDGTKLGELIAEANRHWYECPGRDGADPTIEKGSPDA